MAFVDINNPCLRMVGISEGHLNAPTSGQAGALNAANLSLTMFGNVWTEDGGTHTIDTTGSSSIGWLASTVLFANAGTTVKVGICNMDAANGNPIRPANASGVITFDVSRSIVGGSGGITTGSWHEHAPNSGSKTIAHGDLVGVAIQVTARAGADSIGVAGVQPISGAIARPGCTTYNGTTFASVNIVPACAITFNDGVKGNFVGGAPYSVTRTALSFNNSSSPNEVGMHFKFPFPVVLSGVTAICGFADNADIVAYLDPFGTPSAQRTISVTPGQIGNLTQVATSVFLFSPPLIIPANTSVVIAIKPTTTTNILWGYRTLGSAGNQSAYGFESYAVERSSGAFSVRSSGTHRMQISPLVDSLMHHARPTFGLGI